MENENNQEEIKGENISVPATCPVCHQAISPGFYFCPNCGNNLKEEPVKISIISQIGLYIFSILLPPFGLWPGIKYAKKKSPQARQVGYIMIALTLISAIIMTWQIFAIFENYLNQMNEVLGGF